MTAATFNSSTTSPVSETYTYTSNGNMTNRTRGGDIAYGGETDVLPKRRFPYAINTTRSTPTDCNRSRFG